MKEKETAKLKHLGSGPEGSKKQYKLRRKSKKPEATKKKKDLKPKLIVQEESASQSISLEEQNVVFKPNEGPQTKFLASSEREVLYGGAAGGGKSYAMLADPLRYMGHSQFSGLLLRHTTEELRELIWKSQEIYPQIYPGIKWSERKMQWVAPNGLMVLPPKENEG